MKPTPVRPDPGQESVWDYPRPPRLERTNRHIQIIVNEVVVADTRSAWRVLETSHAPTYYIPPADILMRHLQRVPRRRTMCEWKGQAHYYDVVVGDERREQAAWAYAAPTPAFASIKDHLAFYVRLMDQCLVDGEVARPQPGGFYGGWVTDDVVGPFKGEPGTTWW
ncbi:MAG: DUF427 domain-containing protein [Candidatus Promineifilaceae bacterium]|nr:DUF427 domain-containing protein [Candidatus Promineifilaceae bacterium]